MDREKIGQFILEQRKKLNLTQSELAEQLHVTSQAVSKWENGRGIPDIELLKELSNYFQVDLQEILNGEIKTKDLAKRGFFACCFYFYYF
ncbi:MAG: helix-turn-helix transcriptional regulator [Bacilli bacterium]|nr:helix-turn-helix transcriptional regulator [Bacilli bacterium]